VHGASFNRNTCVYVSAKVNYLKFITTATTTAFTIIIIIININTITTPQYQTADTHDWSS